jgi:hypothetical protein
VVAWTPFTRNSSQTAKIAWLYSRRTGLDLFHIKHTVVLEYCQQRDHLNREVVSTDGDDDSAGRRG